MNYSDDFIVLEITLITGRTKKETRLAMLSSLEEARKLAAAF